MHALRRRLRDLARRLGYDISSFERGRPGSSALDDMARFMADDRPIIFDVGANVGQSIERFRSRFPRSIIHSFEPGPAAFLELQRRAAALAGVHVWNRALGAAPGSLTLLENSVSDMSSFLPLAEAGWGEVARRTDVEVTTVDRFCDDHDIARIDILKSDTQGFDLEVLKGASSMFAANRIRAVYLEINFIRIYENLPTLSDLYAFLTARDFQLVSFYDFRYRDHRAAWTDALFVHASAPWRSA